jgi:tRNA (cytidine/uridine-2'-O-)-methyltransferase
LADGIRIALYQPDIAGNTGTILRMAACLGVAVDIIEPAGFDLSDRNLRRAGMDYLEMAALTRHVDFARFEDWRRSEARRLLLFSTKAALPYTAFSFADGDILLFGRESAGVPDQVRDRAPADPDEGRRAQPQRCAQRRHGGRRSDQAGRLKVP